MGNGAGHIVVPLSRCNNAPESASQRSTLKHTSFNALTLKSADKRWEKLMNINFLPAQERAEYIQGEKQFCQAELDRYCNAPDNSTQREIARWNVLHRRNQFMELWFNGKINKSGVTYNPFQMKLI